MPRHARILILASIAIIAAAGVVMHVSRTEALLPPPPPPKVTFNYDSLGWIVQEVYPHNSVAHDYDAAGNRTTVTVH